MCLTSINISANSPTGPLTINILIDETNILCEGNIVRKLAARRKIQELEESITVDSFRGWSIDEQTENEDRNEIKKRIVDLGLENNLTSQYTSFIGIDHTTGDILSDRPISTREIKNKLPLDFGVMATSMDRVRLSARDVSTFSACDVDTLSSNVECSYQCSTRSSSNWSNNSRMSGL